MYFAKKKKKSKKAPHIFLLGNEFFKVFEKNFKRYGLQKTWVYVLEKKRLKLNEQKERKMFQIYLYKHGVQIKMFLKNVSLPKVGARF